jgi:hypothetical protein
MMVHYFLTFIFLVLLRIGALAQEAVEKLPSDPEHATISESRKIGWGGQHSAGLHKCFVRGDTIDCLFVITNLESGNARDYNAGAAIGSPRLIDNFHIEHKISRSFYLNGRGQQQEQMNLGQNEAAWFVVQFEGGSNDITSARIITDGLQFSGRVEK